MNNVPGVVTQQWDVVNFTCDLQVPRMVLPRDVLQRYRYYTSLCYLCYVHTVHHDAETQLARIGPLGNSAAYINNCTADYHYIYIQKKE